MNDKYFDPPTPVRRRGDSLYGYCCECEETFSDSISELRYEGGDASTSTCAHCEKEVCHKCWGRSECYTKDGKRFNHDDEEIKEEE